MKLFVQTLLLVLCITGFAQAQEPVSKREFVMKEGDTSYVMKQYFFCLLKRGDKAGDFSKAELEKIQEGHLAHINRLANEGKVQIAGPFGDDTELRGILIFDTETQEEAEKLQAQDPAVLAGRLKVEMHHRWAAKGSILK